MTNEATTHEQGALEWSDLAPTYCEGVADLYRWSANFEDFKPFRKFLDLIGFAETYYGDDSITLADWKSPAEGLGYLELSKLADALQDYTARPEDVERWLFDLFAVEAKSGL